MSEHFSKVWAFLVILTSRGMKFWKDIEFVMNC